MKKDMVVKILPVPGKLEISEGYLDISGRYKVIYPADFAGNRGVIEKTLPHKAQNAKDSEFICRIKKIACAAEAYKLIISREELCLMAADSAGIFYGSITISILIRQFGNKLPCMNIEDAPAYPWRGLHLDVSRHFFSIDYIKNLLHAMALCKLNKFHWHLTDDQGWRIEIKKYPRLTEIGAWRNTADAKSYGGYYSQQEIREIIDYATRLHIEIIPEIEMPGHARSAISAIPNLSCRSENLAIDENWGVFDDVFCLGKEATISFLEDVLDEVCHLFPSGYLHTGGDECPATTWKNCPLCNKRAKKYLGGDVDNLQNWFTKKIAAFLKSRGKTMIGWEEILGADIPEDTIIMVWKKDGTEVAKQAIQRGHRVILSPNFYYYFDWKQLSSASEAGRFGVTTLSKTYSYDPSNVSVAGISNSLILGVQGNIWTEKITSPSQVSYMAFPRAIAVAETGWSPAEKDFKQFLLSLSEMTGILESIGISPCAKVE
jgi:hexosaminidase